MMRSLITSFSWVVPVVLCATITPAPSSHADELKPDEVLLFYPALAKQRAGGWDADLHGIIYEPERERLLTATVRKALDLDEENLTAEELALCRKRIRYFLVDHERGKDLTAKIGDRRVRLSSSAANGHFRGRLRGDAGEGFPSSTNRHSSIITLDARLPAPDGGEWRVPLEVQLLGDTGISVISDIDDTIKVSEIRDRKALIRNTFCLPFKPVPGMAELYRSWATAAGAQFHYLTASPWQLYLPLSEFTRSNGFPAGTFFMKDFRAKDSSFLQLFASPERYKPGVIEKLLKEFPRRQFVLVGDSGEKDPEIYAAMARKHPQQVRAIFIRDVTDEPATALRYQKTFAGLPPQLWQVFKEAAEVIKGLAGEIEALPVKR